jgi:hypothetical protein
MKSTRKLHDSGASDIPKVSKPPLSQINSSYKARPSSKVHVSSILVDQGSEKQLKNMKQIENYENYENIGILKNSQNKFCNLCKKDLNSSTILQTSKCKEHYYCSSCISKKLSTKRSDFCPFCLQYLSLIGEQPSKGALRCNLCPAFPRHKISKCNVHDYCEICFAFIKKNQSKHLENLASCHDCIVGLELINSPKISANSGILVKQKSKESESFFNLVKSQSSEMENFGIIAKKHLRDESNENFFNNSSGEGKVSGIRERSDSKDGKMSEIHLKTHLNNEKIPDTQSKTHLNTKKIHEIQAGYLKNSKNDEIHLKTSKDPEINLLPTSPKKISKPSSNPSSFKLSFNELKSESSPESLQEISSPILSKSIDLSVSCTKCRGFHNIKGFLCNHNLCVFCLNLACLAEITKFFQQYQVDQSIIKNDFCYKCPVQNCGRPISIPTLKVMSDHLTLLKEKNYEQATNVYSFLTFESVGPWVPYFDGLSSWCVFE